MPKILVVDDSRLTRRIICKALTDAGHEVSQAVNGQEGLEAFREGEFDLVLSDLLMPVMDGFQFTETIRNESPSTPIIVSTADIQESSQERCREIGVNRILNKPAKADTITSTVEELLATSEIGG